MFRGIITALFAGAVVTGLASTVGAEPIARSQPGRNHTTLSGESLRGLGRRNVPHDYSTNLSDTSPVSEPAPISLEDDNAESASQSQTISVFGIDIDISRWGSSQSRDNQTPTSVGLSNLEVSAGGSTVDAEEVVKVRYQLLSPPEN